MRKLGVPQEQLQQRRKAQRQEAALQEDGEHVYIAPHLAQVVWFFSTLRTHWRAVAGGKRGIVWLGLDWAAVDATMRRRGVKPPDTELFYDWLDVLDVEGVRIKNGL